jgi:hypothetical protein
MTVLRSVLLFALGALAEIGGAWLTWASWSTAFGPTATTCWAPPLPGRGGRGHGRVPGA